MGPGSLRAEPAASIHVKLDSSLLHYTWLPLIQKPLSPGTAIGYPMLHLRAVMGLNFNARKLA